MAGSSLTRADRLLLAAAYSEPTIALDAWRAWLGAVDFESHHDSDVYGLLPAISRNLRDSGAEDVHLQRLHGVQRKSWVDNRATIRDGLSACDLMNDAGIEHLVVLRSGLIAAYAPPPALRPLDRFELLIPREAWGESQAALRSAGWIVVSGPVVESSEHCFRSVFRSPGGRHVSVQSELLASADQAPSWSSVLDSCVDGVLDGRTVRVPGPSYQLLSICAPAGVLYMNSLLQRVHDAIPVFQSSHVIDPDELVCLAIRGQVVAAARAVFEALDSAIPGLVPEELAVSVRNAERAPWEELEMRRRQSRYSLPRRFWSVWYDHRRLAATEDVASLIAGLPPYLLKRWNLTSFSQIPRRGLAGLRRAIHSKESS